MSHYVVAGGFGSNERLMRRVANVLSGRYKREFAALTFRQIVDDPVEADATLRQATVLAHSGAMWAMRRSAPRAVRAIAPPLPVPQHKLIFRAATSGFELAKRAAEERLANPEINSCIAQVALELTLHPYGNLRRIPELSRFNAIDAGIAAKEVGVDVGMAFMRGDRLFRPTSDDLLRANRAGVDTPIIDGAHEEFVLNPLAVVDEFEAELKAQEQLRTSH